MWRSCVDAERRPQRSSRSCPRRLSLCREERRLCAVSVQQANGSGSSEEFAVFFFADGSLADVAHASGGGKVRSNTNNLDLYNKNTYTHTHTHTSSTALHCRERGILFSLFFTLCYSLKFYAKETSRVSRRWPFEMVPSGLRARFVVPAPAKPPRLRLGGTDVSYATGAILSSSSNPFVSSLLLGRESENNHVYNSMRFVEY